MDVSLVLVPVDFSPCAEAAVSYAGRFSLFSKADWVLIHVVDVREAQRIADYTGGDVEEVKARLASEAREAAESFVDRLGIREQVKEIIVSHGVPFQEIAIKAKELQVDLVLMGGYGSKGKGQLDEIFFGSTVEKVIRLLPCPVLCVPMDWEGRESG